MYAITEDGLASLQCEVSQLRDLITQLLGEDRNKDSLVYNNRSIQDLLGVGEKLIKKYRDEGLLPYHNIGDKFWYTKNDVDKFLKLSYVSAYRSE